MESALLVQAQEPREHWRGGLGEFFCPLPPQGVRLVLREPPRRPRYREVGCWMEAAVRMVVLQGHGSWALWAGVWACG